MKIIAQLARQIGGVKNSTDDDPPSGTIAETLVDQILALGKGETIPSPPGVAEFLLRGGSTAHLAIEATLLNTLRGSLGPSAKPIMLNAWSAAFWFLLATYRIGP